MSRRDEGCGEGGLPRATCAHQSDRSPVYADGGCVDRFAAEPDHACRYHLVEEVVPKRCASVFRQQAHIDAPTVDRNTALRDVPPGEVELSLSDRSVHEGGAEAGLARSKRRVTFDDANVRGTGRLPSRECGGGEAGSLPLDENVHPVDV